MRSGDHVSRLEAGVPVEREREVSTTWRSRPSAIAFLRLPDRLGCGEFMKRAAANRGTLSAHRFIGDGTPAGKASVHCGARSATVYDPNVRPALLGDAARARPGRRTSRRPPRRRQGQRRGLRWLYPDRADEDVAQASLLGARPRRDPRWCRCTSPRRQALPLDLVDTDEHGDSFTSGCSTGCAAPSLAARAATRCGDRPGDARQRHRSGPDGRDPVQAAAPARDASRGGRRSRSPMASRDVPGRLARS